MARALTAAVAAEIQKQTVSPILLYEGEFDGGNIHLWSGTGNIVWNGNTYIGAGRLLNVTPVEETVEVRAASVQIGLSGLPSDLVSLALSSARQGKKGRLWLGFLSTTNGKALQFSAASLQYASTSIPLSPSMSFEGWAASTQSTWSENGVIISARNGNGAGSNGMVIHPNSGTTSVRAVSIDNAGVQTSTGSVTPSGGIQAANHYVAVVDDVAKTVMLYINGALVSTSSTYAGSRVAVANAAVAIGKDDGLARYLNGVMDEVRIYNRALSAAEVSAHYAGIYTDDSNLALYFPFEEGTGSVSADQSGNGRNATLMNSPAWVTGIGNAQQGRIIADPYQIFTGLLDVPSMDESGDTANIAVSYENRLIGLLTANDRRYTPEDQHVDFPGDTGFDKVAGLQDASIIW